MGLKLSEKKINLFYDFSVYSNDNLISKSLSMKFLKSDPIIFKHIMERGRKILSYLKTKNYSGAYSSLECICTHPKTKEVKYFKLNTVTVKENVQDQFLVKFQEVMSFLLPTG